MLTNLAKTTVIVSIVFPVLATLAVALRLYARRCKSLRLGPDDYVILVALVVSVGGAVPYAIGAFKYGIGAHTATLNHHQIRDFGKMAFAIQFIYIFAVAPVKISVLLFYRRIFGTRKFGIALMVVGVVVVLWTIAFFFATLLQAWPISFNWTHIGTPTDFPVMYWVCAATDIFLDVITLALPLPMIWGLQMSQKRKWMVTGIFGLGAFITVSSIVRLSYLVQVSNPLAYQDITYSITNIIIWSLIEPCTSVICACLPTLGPIFQTHSPESLLGSLRSYISLPFRNRSNRSRSTVWSDKPAHNKNTDNSSTSSAKAFHRMSDDAVIYTNAQGTQLDDLESQRNKPEKGIAVQHTLSSVSDNGRDD